MIEALRTYGECFVCGEDNPAGLQAAFTLGEAPDELRGAFTADGRYQGYPGRLHGGVLASLFDETLGRAVALHGHWSFTARLDVRFRQPVPVGARVEVVARQVRDRGRFVEADGEARLPDGQVVAEARGLFLKLQPDEEATLRRTIWPDSGAADGDRPAAEGQ
jgi:acyl-coenzyme A thioesterase PaaI-like protein